MHEYMIMRLFRLDDASGMTLVRFIDSEQVTNPIGATEEEDWSYGMRHQMEPFEDDVETIEQYHVYYSGERKGEL